MAAGRSAPVGGPFAFPAWGRQRKFGMVDGMRESLPFKTLLQAGRLAEAARATDLDAAEIQNLAEAITIEIPHWTEERVLPKRVDAAILAGTEAGHFRQGGGASRPHRDAASPAPSAAQGPDPVAPDAGGQPAT